MPIYGIVGTPGAGKSIFAVSQIIAPIVRAANKAGEYREIYHNIEGLNVDRICDLCGVGVDSFLWREHFHTLDVDDDGNKDELTPRYFWIKRGSLVIEKYADITDHNKVKERVTGQMIPAGAVIILDEVQNIYSARNTLSQASDIMKDYITKHRHFKHTLFWLTQNAEAVDVSFRRNTEQIWKLERRENIAFTKSGKNAASVKKYLGWDNIDLLTPLSVTKFAYDSRYYGTYKSYDDTAKFGGEEVRHTTNMWLSSTPLKVVAVLIVLCIIGVCVTGSPLDKMTKGMSKSAAPAAAAPHGALAPSGATAPAPLGAGSLLDKYKQDNVKRVCYENTYKLNGETYFIHNGQTIPFERGVIYEFCTK